MSQRGLFHWFTQSPYFTNIIILSYGTFFLFVIFFLQLFNRELLSFLSIIETYILYSYPFPSQIRSPPTIF